MGKRQQEVGAIDASEGDRSNNNNNGSSDILKRVTSQVQLVNPQRVNGSKGVNGYAVNGTNGTKKPSKEELAAKYLSTTTLNLAPSATLGITALAQKLQKESPIPEKPVITLTVGQSDLPPPPQAKLDFAEKVLLEAASQAEEGTDVRTKAITALKAINPDRYADGIPTPETSMDKYTLVKGNPKLRGLIAKNYKEKHGLEFNPETEIFVSDGGKGALSMTIAAICNKGDKFLIPAPHWVSYEPIVKLFGGTPIRVECSEENNYKITPEILEPILEKHGKDVKGLFINSPNNPTGAIYTSDELKALGGVAKEHGLLVIQDEMYKNLVYKKYDNTDAKYVNMLEVVPELAPQVMTIHAASKDYLLPGARIGWSTGPEWWVSAAAKCQGHLLSGPGSHEQALVECVLEGDQSFLEKNKQTFQKRRNNAMQKISEAGFENVKEPDGAFYVFLDTEKFVGGVTEAGKVINNAKDYAEALLEEERVAVVPGDDFGVKPENASGVKNGIRISFALSRKTMNEAMERIGNFNKQLVASKTTEVVH